jgi:GNAT superfamily N-acetyltransferase
VVNALHINDYAGDFEDVANLTRRAWTSAYAAHMLFPLWDAGFLRWQAGSEARALLPAAYDGTKLVGCFFSIPQSLRMGDTVLPIGLASWCTVDPAYRSMQPALRLIEALRARHEELGLAFSLGVVSGDRSSLAYRFWSQYARAHPRNLRFLFRFGFWIKMLAPERVAEAAVKPWERRAIRLLGPLLSGTGGKCAPDLRWYRPDDLANCARLVERASQRCDWALLWPPERLAAQLESPASGTVVLEREGRIGGMVNFHTLWFQGRKRLRAALIDLWADDGLSTADRVRLLRYLCQQLRERDVHLVVALRSAPMPALAFAANRFVPQPAHSYFVALFAKEGLALEPPKSWSLVLR